MVVLEQHLFQMLPRLTASLDMGGHTVDQMPKIVQDTQGQKDAKHDCGLHPAAPRAWASWRRRRCDPRRRIPRNQRWWWWRRLARGGRHIVFHKREDYLTTSGCEQARFAVVGALVCRMCSRLVASDLSLHELRSHRGCLGHRHLCRRVVCPDHVFSGGVPSWGRRMKLEPTHVGCYRPMAGRPPMAPAPPARRPSPFLLVASGVSRITSAEQSLPRERRMKIQLA